MRQSEQEVGVGTTSCYCAGTRLGSPRAKESKRAAGDVGLIVVVEAQLPLPTEVKGVLSVNPGQRRRNVVLRVVVANGAVALALSSVIRERERRCWWRSDTVRN